MDLETENRIAAILMKEAAELRREAARDGIDAYLRPPNVRGRPNSRFLTATVLGVQQSNRAVEVNEMWRAREKEKQMDINNNSRSSYKRQDTTHDSSSRVSDSRFESKKQNTQCSESAVEGELRDTEIEEFLHSRAKRGRGTIGSRMDETGPYLPPKHHLEQQQQHIPAAIVGPKKPSFILNSNSSSDEERQKRSKKHHHKSIDKKNKNKKRSSKHHK